MSGDRDPAPSDPLTPEEESKRQAEIRAALVASAIKGFRITARTAEALAAAGVHKIMPLLQAYLGPMAWREAQSAAKADGDAAAPGATDTTNDSRQLSRQEQLVLRAVALKVFVELLEITSRTDPPYKDAPAYQAYNADGVFQAPHLMYVLSLALAARRLIGGAQKGDGGAAPINEADRVAYLAVAPGEYQAAPGPLTPTMIRRSAMRERSYNPPALAMLARRTNSFYTAPATATQPQMTAYAYRPGTAYGAAGGTPSATAGMLKRVGPGSGAGGCAACGGRTGGCAACGGGGSKPGGMVFPPARHNDDGSCAPILKVSCDTQWRIRECLKLAVCDLIRCVGEELCDDGKLKTPEIGVCLERFVCTVVTCLPEAICPAPEPPPEPCCTEVIDCDCNFAVGD